MIPRPALFLAAAMVLQTAALAQQAAPAGQAPARQDADGTKSYYEPEKIERNGRLMTFSLYASSTPGARDEVGRYVINCDSRELASIARGQTSAPWKLLPGEALYPLSKKLCDWDQPGFFKKMFDKGVAL